MTASHLVAGARVPDRGCEQDDGEYDEDQIPHEMLFLECRHRADYGDGFAARRSIPAACEYRCCGVVAASFEFENQVPGGLVLISHGHFGECLRRAADAVAGIGESFHAYGERPLLAERVAAVAGDAEPVRRHVAPELLTSAVERAANAQRRCGLERGDQIAEVPPVPVVVRKLRPVEGIERGAELLARVCDLDAERLCIIVVADDLPAVEDMDLPRPMC